jgi:hypothetical protein
VWRIGTKTLRHTGHLTKPTLYDIPPNHSVFSRNSEGSKKLPDDGRLLPKHVGAGIKNKVVVQISAYCWSFLLRLIMHGTNIKYIVTVHFGSFLAIPLFLPISSNFNSTLYCASYRTIVTTHFGSVLAVPLSFPISNFMRSTLCCVCRRTVVTIHLSTVLPVPLSLLISRILYAASYIRPVL